MAICFEEEREWRLILNSFPKWKEIKVGDMSFTEPTYRVSKGQLISYVELSFEIGRASCRERVSA